MQNIGQPTGPAPIKEYVTDDVLAEYDQLLSDIQNILVKSPPTEEDSLLLEKKLKELKKLQDQGLTGPMDAFVDVLFAFVEVSGGNPSENNFKLTPTQIQAMGKAHITIAVPKNEGQGGGWGRYEEQTMTLAEALAIMLNPDYDPTATKKLGDMLLEFSNWGYDMYTQQLKDLKQQIDIATAAINNLNELLKILNMMKVKYPENYAFPPTSWNDIPKELQDKLRSSIPEFPFINGNYVPFQVWNADGTPTERGMNEVIAPWIQKNADTYAGWSDDYFRRELGMTFDPQPDARSATAQLLSARDQLIKQLFEMEKAGGADLDKGPGSPYATIKGVLDDIDKKFPPADFPYPSQAQMGTKPYTPTDWYAVGAFDETKGKTALESYVTEGNKTNSSLAKAIDDAIQSNQNLSSKMSDEIKAKNLTLQTFFDILTQVADSLNKILTSSAQKTNR